ncbi:MAG TPA: hypothetical protein VGD02_02780 [Gemmatimonadaceae bacterium]|jgi:hypothetical protein
MDPDVQSFGQVAVIIVFLVASIVTIGIVAWKSVTRQKAPRVNNQLPDVRLEQLQQSIDAIAVEVERIAEAQRFSAKLLAQRGETSTIPR